MRVWILTSEVNDYSQYGEYFIKVYANKPSLEELSRELNLDLEFQTSTLVHIMNGGGRQWVEDTWYYLREQVC